VDVLTATSEEQEQKRRTRRGGKNQREEVARQNREGAKKFPVLVGDLEAIRSSLQSRPAPVPREVGLQEGEASWKTSAKGTSLFMHGYSEKTERPSHSECKSPKPKCNSQEPTTRSDGFKSLLHDHTGNNKDLSPKQVCYSCAKIVS